MGAFITIPVIGIRALAQELLSACGADSTQSKVFVDSLIWSGQIRRSTHGIWRLPSYCKRLEFGLNKCPCSPRFEEKAAALYGRNGDNGLDHYVGDTAMTKAVNIAQTASLAAVSVYNSNHFGTGVYYVHLATRRNMIGIAVSK